MARERGKRYVHNIAAARRLRQAETDSEQLLWEALRDRRFLGLKFRRQHAVQRFVLDFYCHERRLAIDVDAPVHDSPEQRTADLERQQLIEQLGIRFFRVSAADVTHGLASLLDSLERAIADSPSPAKSGEGAGG
jgi:very-short-patch-repair endonuclease